MALVELEAEDCGGRRDSDAVDLFRVISLGSPPDVPGVDPLTWIGDHAGSERGHDVHRCPRNLPPALKMIYITIMINHV